MTHRMGLLGVLYAEDFDADDDDDSAPATAATAAAEPELIEPSFSAAEIEAARRAGYDAGQQAAERGLAAARLQMLTLVAKGLADARGEAAAVAEDAAEAMGRCILSSLLSCLPTLCARHGEAELRALARHVLPSLAEEPRVTVRANPHLLPMLREEVACLDEEVAALVVLLPTDALPPGDARITWRDGSVVRDTARARAALTDALAALGLLEEETADA